MSRTLFRAALSTLAIAALPFGANAQQKRVITFSDFAATRVVSDPQASPDGRLVLYAVRTADVAANTRASHTYVVPVAGGPPQLFPGRDGGTEVAATEARWSPDGKHVAYIAGDQLWIADADGVSRRQLSHLTRGATGPIWSPSGDRILFTSNVYPECASDECNAAKSKAEADSKVKAHIADQLMFRQPIS